MVDKTSQMFITGPDVVKTVTGEDVSFEETRRRTHAQHEIGQRALPGHDEEDAISYVKELLSFCH